MLPFPILSLYTDSGAEFINRNLIRYCQLHHIRLTRSQSDRKNDNCRVEQRNFDAVRKLVGFLRYDQEQELALLAELYRLHGRLSNYLYPCQRLVEKIRQGSKVGRHYGRPASPISDCSPARQSVRSRRRSRAPNAASCGPWPSAARSGGCRSSC